ncbi:MAG: glycosyltransferase family 4 protein, partial [Conexivisphaerales archaeon]
IEVLLFEPSSQRSKLGFEGRTRALYDIRIPILRLIRREKSKGAGKLEASWKDNFMITPEGIVQFAFTIACLPRLIPCVKSFGYRIVHLHSMYQTIILFLFKRLFNLDYLIVYHSHNHTVHMSSNFSKLSFKARTTEGLALRLADHVVVPTKAVACSVFKNFKIGGKVTVIPGGVDVGWPSVKRRDPVDPMTLLCVARIQPRKNQLMILEAVSMLDLLLRERLEVVLVGPIEDEDYFKRIMDFASQKQLRVRYKGVLSEAELSEIYANSTLFVFPTIQETQGLVILEAMTYGLPVISSRIEPIVEIAANVENSCMLIDPSDRAELARAIERVVKDSTLYNQLSQKGRMLAEMFDWKRVSQRYIDLLGDLAKG